MKPAAKFHNDGARKAQALTTRLLGRSKGGITKDSIIRATMLDHLTATCAANDIFSLLGQVVLSNLHDTLHERATKRGRKDRVAGENELDTVPDVDEHDVAGSCFFKIVMRNPSQKKIMKTSIGVGGRIGEHQIAVTLHKSIPALSAPWIPCDSRRCIDSRFFGRCGAFGCI